MVHESMLAQPIAVNQLGDFFLEEGCSPVTDLLSNLLFAFHLAPSVNSERL